WWILCIEELFLVADAVVLRGHPESCLLFFSPDHCADGGTSGFAWTADWLVRHVGAGPAGLQRSDCRNYGFHHRHPLVVCFQRHRTFPYYLRPSYFHPHPVPPSI